MSEIVLSINIDGNEHCGTMPKARHRHKNLNSQDHHHGPRKAPKAPAPHRHQTPILQIIPRDERVCMTAEIIRLSDRRQPKPIPGAERVWINRSKAAEITPAMINAGRAVLSDYDPGWTNEALVTRIFAEMSKAVR